MLSQIYCITPTPRGQRQSQNINDKNKGSQSKSQNITRVNVTKNQHTEWCNKQ